jgi:hypothetical protein
MSTSAREDSQIVDEAAGHDEPGLRQVAWWNVLGPCAERPAAGRSVESHEPVGAARSTTWSRWA